LSRELARHAWLLTVVSGPFADPERCAGFLGGVLQRR